MQHFATIHAWMSWYVMDVCQKIGYDPKRWHDFLMEDMGKWSHSPNIRHTHPGFALWVHPLPPWVSWDVPFHLRGWWAPWIGPGNGKPPTSHGRGGFRRNMRFAQFMEGFQWIIPRKNGFGDTDMDWKALHQEEDNRKQNNLQTRGHWKRNKKCFEKVKIS